MIDFYGYITTMSWRAGIALEELGLDTHAVFVNESGRHWFTALNAYRHFATNVPNTARVWTWCFSSSMKLPTKNKTPAEKWKPPVVPTTPGDDAPRRRMHPLAVVAVAVQAVPFGRDHSNPPITAEPTWDSPRTRDLTVRACFACLSNEVQYPWYSQIAPMSWAVQLHVEQGRA